ncbi:MAG: glycosyltransferase family 4 protein [Clostridia bacterium]|nr:glycosyltransferase family 4 protein [Clostridia bacterium]
MSKEKPLIALLTNNDDDVFCFRKELIDGILAEGYEMLISCPYGEKFELMKEYTYRYDDPVIDRRGTSVVKDFGLLLHYFRLFGKHRPDVILTYTAKPGVYGSIAAKLRGIPYINNVTGFGSVLSKTGLMRRIIMGLFRFAYRGAECIMFQNAVNMKLAQEIGMVKGEHRLIPGSGVALDRYPVQPYPDGGNGMEGEIVRFNYFGRIMHEKGVDDYIECARRIRKKYPRTEFHMCGFIEPTESHYESDLKKLGDEGIVIYHGSQKDVKPFIANAHAIIHPSTYGEGMSNVLLENASSGRPLITTDNPGCRETVEEGKNGFIYTGGNGEELIAAVEKFLAMPNDERRRMGLEGRAKVEREFDRQTVVRAYLEQIGKILNQR